MKDYEKLKVFTNYENKNRHGVYQWFITWSRWGPYTFAEVIDKLPPTKWCYIVEEDHEDPDKDVERNSMIHLHASVVFKHEIAFHKLRRWIEKTWPDDYKRIDYEPTKSFKDALDYCRKESLEFMERGCRPGDEVKPKTKWQLDLEKWIDEYDNDPMNKIRKEARDAKMMRNNKPHELVMLENRFYVIKREKEEQKRILGEKYTIKDSDVWHDVWEEMFIKYEGEPLCESDYSI